MIDVAGIVSQLMTIEQQPLQKLQTELSGLQTKISAWGRVQSALSTLQDASKALYQTDGWTASKAVSGDDATVTASGSSGASGSYSLTVEALARSQSVASRTFAASDTVVGGGTLTIQLGTLSANGTAFTADPARAAVDITIAGGSTLAEVRNAINSANAGVTASIMDDGTGKRLMLTSRETGLAQAFEIAVADSDGDNTDTAGLSAFAASATAATGTNGSQRTQIAADARFTINGLAATASSNRVTETIDGVTLELKKVSATPVTVDVASDQTKHREKIDAFVTAYNAVNKLLGDQTRYDAATKTAGTLQGNSTAVRLHQQLRAAVRSDAGGTDTSSLSMAGFSIGRDGSLSIDSEKIDALLADPSRLKTLFGGTTVGGVTTGGIARSLSQQLSQVLGVDGAITSTTESLQKQRTGIEDRQTRIEDRLEEVEARLTRQYSALDANLARISGSFSAIQNLL